MAETTNISKLIINYLTEEQYTTAKASGLINENELYVTDVQDSTTLDCFEELFTATEGQTLFTLTEGTYQVGESRLTICVNGAQQPSTAYTETSSSSFTFDSGLSAGDSVIARYVNARIVSNITLQAHKSSHASAGNDALTPSDIGAATSTHTHGNITNGGAVGSTPNLPIFTGASGLLETKSIEDAKTLLEITSGLLPKIVVTVDTGSVITCTNGTTTLTGTSTGSYIFEIPNYGTWTVSATLNGETSSTESIVIDTVKIYPITLGYIHIYGFTINEAESNSVASVTYTDGSTSFTKGSSSWDTSPLFANIKPCLFKDGTVVGYLQRNDYTKFENGTAADITSGSAGDVMVEIPKMAYYMEKSGDVITCKVLIGDVDAKTIDAKYSYLPFSRAAEGDRDKIYIGAYLGYDLSSKLRSLSGKTPTPNQTIGAFRTLAQANGTGYQQLPFYQLTLLQILYIMKYGSLNSQTALGRGYVDGNAAAITTGGTNVKGFCFGETTGKLQMKIFGIEDFWGNLRQWIDGLYCNASWAILTTYKAFNDTGSGYLFSNSSGNSGDTGGYMTKAQGGTQTGFNIKTGAGSETTYFADDAYLSAGCLSSFGGSWTAASGAGAFRLGVSYSASDAYSNIGARLCYI